jgi:galactose mutarotase-like enzyme
MTTRDAGTHETGKSLTVTTVVSKPSGVIEVSFTNVGATIMSWKIGRRIAKKELVLGFSDPASYLVPPNENPYFGSFVH